MAFIQFSNRVLLYIGAIRVGAVVSRSYLRQAINENQSHIDLQRTNEEIGIQSVFVEPPHSRKLWDSHGSSVDGSSNHGEFGKSLSLSSDGDKMAVGGYAHVLLYVFASGEWEVENDFTDTLSTGGGYFSVGISSGGGRLAIGAPNNDVQGVDSGRVLVFESSVGSWNQVGPPLSGITGYLFGNDVALSADGGILSIAAYGGGLVEVYEYKPNVQKYDILRTVKGVPEDGYGFSIAMSDDGGVLAVGAPFRDDNKGAIILNDISIYISFVENLPGTATNDFFGYSVAVSSDGLIATGGAWGGSYARSFKYIKNGGWPQLGIDIEGGPSDVTGAAVSLANNGNILAIGAPWSSEYGSQSGRVRFYKLADELWEPLSETVKGDSANDLCGTTVSMSLDGKIVAIGCPGKDNGGYNTGQIQTYEIPADASSGEDNDNDNGVTFNDDKYESNDDFLWETYGEEVDGPFNHGKLGSSLSLSFDGKMMAVGGLNDAVMYTYVNGDWDLTYIFSDIIEKGNGFYSVGLSDDGTHLAVGAPNNDIQGVDSGEVQVFKDRVGSWDLVGKALNGVAGDLFGCEVDLSADGGFCAVGAYGGGYVRILKYNANLGIYETSGNIITGSTDDGFGFSVALSGSGEVLVVGAPFYDANKGFIRLYDIKNDSYVKTIESATNNDYFGHSVTLSFDGLRAAGGARGGDYVRAYEFVGIFWKQLGIDIDGYGDAFGYSVSMSENGHLIAVGAPWNGLYGAQSGRAYVFELEGGKWKRIGNNMNGGTVHDQCGTAVSLASNGQKMVMGCPGKDADGYMTGMIQGFKVPGPVDDDAPSATPTSTFSFSPSSNPTPAPTKEPTKSPTAKPTSRPTVKPTKNPTIKPTRTRPRTSNPTARPTDEPTQSPFLSSDDDNLIIDDGIACKQMLPLFTKVTSSVNDGLIILKELVN